MNEKNCKSSTEEKDIHTCCYSTKESDRQLIDYINSLERVPAEIFIKYAEENYIDEPIA